MRIGIKVGSVTTWLAGDPAVGEHAHSSASDLRIAATAQKQTDRFVRAAAAKERDRGNLSTTVSFSTTRKFSTPQTAELWAADYDSAFPRAGTLVIQTTAPGGTGTSRYMADTVVDPPTRQIIGCSVLLTYSATGGAITTT